MGNTHLPNQHIKHMGCCHNVRILTSLVQEISQKNRSNQTKRPTKDKQNYRERDSQIETGFWDQLRLE